VEEIVELFFEGDKNAVLLLHGFTGTPVEMKEFGEYLSKKGFTVYIPLLKGHGTNWKDLNRVHYTDFLVQARNCFEKLYNASKSVSVVGFSASGAIALYLAEKFPVEKIILINTTVLNSLAYWLGGIFSFVLPVFPAFSDVKKPVENPLPSYKVYPLKAVRELLKLNKIVIKHLKDVSAPILIFASQDDHTVPPKNSTYIYKNVSSKEKTLVELENSYHMAVIDYDKDIIFKKSVQFLQKT